MFPDDECMDEVETEEVAPTIPRMPATVDSIPVYRVTEALPNNLQDVVVLREGCFQNAQVGYYDGVWQVYQVDGTGESTGPTFAIEVDDVQFWSPLPSTMQL